LRTTEGIKEKLEGVVWDHRYIVKRCGIQKLRIVGAEDNISGPSSSQWPICLSYGETATYWKNAEASRGEQLPPPPHIQVAQKSKPLPNHQNRIKACQWD